MEGNGRRLGWIAIALSGLALVVALGGRAQSRWQANYGPQQYYGPPASQTAPGPQGQFGPQGPGGQQGQFGPQGQFGQQDQFGPQRGGRRDFETKRPDGFGGPHRFFPGLFFFPFMLIGGLFKIAIVVLLVMLGLRLIRGRGFGGPWGRGPGGRGPWNHGEHGEHREPGSPDRPGPEQPPYTGDTQQM